MSGKVLTLRRPDTCVVCGNRLDAGTRAEWDPTARTVACLPEAHAVPAMTAGLPVPAERERAGASAQREFERRHQARQDRVLAAHPKIGRFLLAVTDDPTDTKVWAQGADGERAVAERLDRIDNVVMLHDRRLRRADGRMSQANIDHIAIAPTGIWVIDAKTHKGRLEVRRTGGLLSPRVERLRINGRDQTKLVEGVHRQVDAVRTALTALELDVPVSGAMCFWGTELPWLDEDIDGIALRGRRGIAKLLGRPGALSAEARQEVGQRLAQMFPRH